jgi:hypothetical protein
MKPVSMMFLLAGILLGITFDAVLVGGAYTGFAQLSFSLKRPPIDAVTVAWADNT